MSWSNPQKMLQDRLRWSRDYRKQMEYWWKQAEFMVYASELEDKDLRPYGTAERNTPESANVPVNISYIVKNLRFIHSQMSSNPPAVTTEATSSDPEDRMKADAADRIVRHCMRAYDMQENVDHLSLQTLIYGTGFTKVVWDSSLGEPIDYDPETDKVLLEGDINVQVVPIWDIFIDPDARKWKDVEYVFQRFYVPMDIAKARWPEFSDYFEKNKITENSGQTNESILENVRYNSIELYEYWERGNVTNNFRGRYCICDKSGKVLGDVRPSPHRFVSNELRQTLTEKGYSPEEIDEKSENLAKGELPFHILTDIDVVNSVYGKSFLDYTGHLQDLINRLDITVSDNCAAHGASKLIVPAGTNVQQDALSSSPVEVIKVSGGQPPHPLSKPSTLPDMTLMRDRLQAGIDHVSGVNDAMFGSMQRETSGSALQYATNQGNMVRRRLFNKYVLVVESMYTSILKLVRKHWTTPKLVYSLGREKINQAVELKGSDIDGGFDIKVAYGTSLSLDPLTRREEILSLLPLFKEAGVPARMQISMLKLNELEGMTDLVTIAESRQKEIYDKIIADEVYIAPEEFQDHENMLVYSDSYQMSREFFDLPLEIRELIREHHRQRLLLAAEEQQGNNIVPPEQIAGQVEPAGIPADSEQQTLDSPQEGLIV